MPAKKKPAPEPVPQFIVCSLCDEPWSAHEEVNGEVSTLECIRLLKMKRYTPTITGYRWQPSNALLCGASALTSITGSQTFGTPTVAHASAAR